MTKNFTGIEINDHREMNDLNTKLPHIAFIVLDTHRADRMSCYGYHRDTTPHIDAFAEKALLYTNAIAPAQWTIPSHASMFSGEPPSTHLTIQSSDSLDDRFTTLAEILKTNGYQTTGFCNNPLVGIINNGFTRGFDNFYNYCGAVPNAPDKPLPEMLQPFSPVIKGSRYLLQNIFLPIQDKFAKYNDVFQAALNPWLVPLWTRFANFKGNTSSSIEDFTYFVKTRLTPDNEQPQFLFFNLMETHLPYTPPDKFVKKYLPYYKEEPEARNFIRQFNTQAARWLTPMEKPYSELEAKTLSDMYDAEIAYQDSLLAELLEILSTPYHQENTLVIIVADHGEMLGEQQLMGHGFDVQQELVHVPLIIRYPGQSEAQQINDPVSITRLFHTALHTANIQNHQTAFGDSIYPAEYSLINSNLALYSPAQSEDDIYTAVVSEAYAPVFALNIMENHTPELIDQIKARLTRRAIYEGQYKLYQIENQMNQLISLDNSEFSKDQESPLINQLSEKLTRFIDLAISHQLDKSPQTAANIDDEIVQQRLRDLGYLE